MTGTQLKNGTMDRGRFVRLLAGVSGCSIAWSLSAKPGSTLPVSYDLMVKVKVGDKSVPGFIAKVDGSSYILTCATLILGNDRLQCETVSGKPLKPLKLELSLNRDIARFLIDSEDGLETESSVKEGDTVKAVHYSIVRGSMEAQSGKVSEIEEEYFRVESLDDQKSYGCPALNKAGNVCGISRVHDAYKMQDDFWEARQVQTVYPLDGDQWISPGWKKFNRRFGAVLGAADEFRHDIYALAKVWLENPSEKLELTENMSNEVKQWVKQHNGMVNRCYNSRRNSGNLNEDPYHAVRNDFRDSCRELGNIVKTKADNLKFLAEDRYITPFLNQELMWRFYELYVFAEYVWRQRKLASTIQ